MKEIKVKKIKPRMNYVITTADRYTRQEVAEIHGGLIRTDLEDTLKPFQKIISLSRTAINDDLKVDDYVCINLSRYTSVGQKKDSMKQSMDEYYNTNVTYNVPTLILDDKEVLRLGTNDIDYVIEEYEWMEIKKKNILETRDSGLIIPNENKLTL